MLPHFLQLASEEGESSVRGVHRIVEVGRDLLGSSSPAPLLKQGQLEQVAQDHAQSSSEYLCGQRLPNLSGQPVAALEHFFFLGV